MWLILGGAGAVGLCLLILWSIRARDQREMDRYSVSPEALHSLQSSGQVVLVFDVRQPLDLLAYPEIIPGAKRIPPTEVLAKPALIPNDQDAVVYCTYPSDKTSRRNLRRALGLRFRRIKFLRGDWQDGKQKAIRFSHTPRAFASTL